MFTLFFTDMEVTDFTSAKTSDTGKFTAYFNHMLNSGIYLPPSQFEACFVSAAHDHSDLDATIQAAKEALQTVF
jgi:glutamate-1-semialdehyde 2,1-aminomutase